MDVTMPRLSDSMEEGTIVKWLVEPGSEVSKGQVLVEIDTDKATMEYEAETAGVLLEVLVPEGETVPIGALIARIGKEGEEAVAPPPDTATSAPPPPATPQPVAPSRPDAGARSNASPVARRLAEELGVDLSTVTGTGPGGSISKADIERAAQDGGGAAPAAAPAPAGGLRGETTVVQPSRLQKVVARRMVEGHAEPDFAVEVEIDMTACMALREDLRRSAERKPSVNDLIVKAVALALRDFPRLNASYTDEGFHLFSRINIGVAVATDEGLVVPTIFDADSKPLPDIGRETAELARKVRDGSVTAAELDGGTFTITNLGMFGVRRFHPILNPPQAGILSVGDVAKRPVVDEHGGILVRDVMSAIVVCDHRIAYGADAARFLARVRELLEQPSRLTE
jgi:pyruvate dehydrogenase E2 component (dihydrolipoamide acetyltransferase)